MKAYSSLSAEERRSIEQRATEIIYPDMRPAYPDHHKRVRDKARELYLANQGTAAA